MDEYTRKCKCIADDLEQAFDDGGSRGLMQYFDDSLDTEYVVDSELNYRGVRIMVEGGGPTTYVSTMTGEVKLSWSTHSGEWGIRSDVIDAIDDLYREIYNMMRGC